MIDRWHRFSTATDLWARSNPWKASTVTGVLMFFVGWVTWGRVGIGVMAGVIWGLMFFAFTAAKLVRAKRRLARTP
jgi:hypothetical protein